MLLTIIHSKITTFILGIFLIAIAVNDIYEELFDPTHEHILIVIGILLVISSFGDLNEGVYKIAQNIAPNKELPILKRVAHFFQLSLVRIFLGVTVLIAAGYGLYEDIEKIHSKSISMGIGLVTMMLPMLKAYLGGENLVKGLENKKRREFSKSQVTTYSD